MKTILFHSVPYIPLIPISILHKKFGRNNKAVKKTFASSCRSALPDEKAGVEYKKQAAHPAEDVPPAALLSV